MNKILTSLIMCTLMIISTNIQSYPSPLTFNVLAQNVPPYAKWGRIVMKETKERYPTAEIVDYLHIGKESDATTSTEKFKLWLIEQNKEFGVLVHIKFDTSTEQIINIEFNEVPK